MLPPDLFQTEGATIYSDLSDCPPASVLAPSLKVELKVEVSGVVPAVSVLPLKGKLAVEGKGVVPSVSAPPRKVGVDRVVPADLTPPLKVKVEVGGFVPAVLGFNYISGINIYVADRVHVKD